MWQMSEREERTPGIGEGRSLVITREHYHTARPYIPMGGTTASNILLLQRLLTICSRDPRMRAMLPTAEEGKPLLPTTVHTNLTIK